MCVCASAVKLVVDSSSASSALRAYNSLAVLGTLDGEMYALPVASKEVWVDAFFGFVPVTESIMVGLCCCFDIVRIVLGVVVGIVVVVVISCVFVASVLAFVGCRAVVVLVNCDVGTYHATPLVVVAVVATYDVGNVFVVVIGVSCVTLVVVAGDFVAN